MKLTEKQQVEVIKFVVDEGIDINYGRLSLCDLRNYVHSSVRDNRRYQLYCDDSKNPCYMIYDDLEPCVKHFLELKKRVRKKH